VSATVATRHANSPMRIAAGTRPTGSATGAPSSSGGPTTVAPCIFFESGERRYRCQFSYKPCEQMGTGMDEYDDLAECASAVLQAQADHVAEQRGDLPGRGA